MRILLIEDDIDTASYLAKGLNESGHTVSMAHNGRDGFFMALDQPYDALVIDRMLPGMDGLSIIRAIRTSGNQSPTLILSALGEVDARVEGLRAGGDDYLVKPFAFSELIARLEALVRRSKTATEQTTNLKVGELEMDLLSHEVKRNHQTIELQPREFRLLEFFMRNSGQVVTRTMLLESVWDYNFDPQTNVIDVHISRLRSKIDKQFKHPMLHTIRGAGYILRASH
jgi:two-component system OmpR family response regulator